MSLHFPLEILHRIGAFIFASFADEGWVQPIPFPVPLEPSTLRFHRTSDFTPHGTPYYIQPQSLNFTVHGLAFRPPSFLL